MRNFICTLILGLAPIFAHSQILVDKKEFVSAIHNAKDTADFEPKIFDNILVGDEGTNRYIITRKLTKGIVEINLDKELTLSYYYDKNLLFVVLARFEYEENVLARLFTLIDDRERDLFIKYLQEEEGYTYYKVDLSNDPYPNIEIGFTECFIKGDNVCYITDGPQGKGRTMFVFESHHAKDYADGE